MEVRRESAEEDFILELVHELTMPQILQRANMTTQQKPKRLLGVKTAQPAAEG